MKLDKEFALKHRFWLLLGVFGVLWLTSLLILLFFLGDPIGDKKKALEDAVTAVQAYPVSGPTRPKNDNFLPPWDKYGTTFKNHKNTVWNIAWSGDDMDPVDADYKDKSPPDSSVVRHVFRNGNWEVMLLFDRTDQGLRIRPDSTIKNVDGGHQDVALDTPDSPDGVWFRLRQDRPPFATSAWDRPELTRFAFEGDKPVAWNQTRTLGEGKQKDGWSFGGVDAAQPMQMQQFVAYPWRGQGDMYTWPSTEHFSNGVFVPGEHPLNQLLLNPSREFSEFNRSYYKGEDEDHSEYRSQFEKLFKELDTWPLPPQPDRKKDPTPVPPPGLPLDPVVFKGGGTAGANKLEDYKALMSLVPINSVTNTPSPEECWLMQEDFWVKRELLYVVRDAVNLAAHMDAVDAKAPEDATIIAHQTFHNANWEVQLLFDRDGEGGKLRVRLDSTIKNIHNSHRDQALGTPATPDGVWFRLRPHDGPPTMIAFEGAPLGWGQQAKMSDGKYKDKAKDSWTLKGNPDLNQPMQLEQVFDVTNAPITRIDAIAISQVSHRNANRALAAAKPERFGLKPAAPAPAAPAAGANSNPGGTGGSPAITAPGGPTGGDKTPAASSKTPNYGLERNRYIFVTDQSRHLPVAVTLTVDQSHLHEVLAGFANSRLRFQTTQVEFRRVPAAPSPSSTSPGGPGGDNPMGTGTNPFPVAPLTPSTGGPPPGSTGPPGGVKNPNGGSSNPGNQGTGGTTVLADNPNLIEVTIYGIASLYERPETTIKGKVKTAAGGRVTITGDDNKDLDLPIGDAKIVIDGKDGKAEDLKAGAAVTATISVDRVVKIEVGGPR